VALGQWLTVSEASRVLGLSRTTLLAAEEAGLLTAARTPGGHRRYDPAELRRYAERAGADTVAWPAPGAIAAPPAPEAVHAVDAPAVAATVRAAVRPLVHALEADSAGLYLRRDGRARFAAAFGIPRWLAERLTAAAPPRPVLQVLDTRRTCLFDPAETGFPEHRATGHGVVVAVPGGADGRPAAGALFVVGQAALHAGEVRVVEAFADVLARLVADQQRIVDLERRLERIAAISTTAAGHQITLR
jgi:excisionase family DNA binding protein